MKRSPVDFYVLRVNQIVDAKYSKSLSEAKRAKFINALYILLGISAVILSIGLTSHFILKAPRVVEKIVEVEKINEKVVYVDKIVDKIITREVTTPIILSDGSTVFGNGTILKKDGSIVSDLDGLIDDIADAAAQSSQNLTNVTHYSLFVQEDIIYNGEKHPVSTGYAFNLSADKRHPTNQWCFYNIDLDVTKFIARIEENPYEIIDSDEITSFEKAYLKEGCKWLTPKVTSHFIPVDEREIESSLKNKVNTSLSLFEDLVGKSTKQITVNYGRFDNPKEADTLGTCFLNGNEMQISIDQLESVSQKYVSAVVFHELGHCILGKEHINDPSNIMNTTLNQQILAQSPEKWANSLRN